ncbi:MAG: hypothetical protein ACRD2J_16995 [Thermoanaerobaculia bacterium]
MKRDQDKLLIVENDPLVTRAVEKAAADLDLCPVTVTDGWDAIGRLESDEYVAVVVDTDVPDRSGYGLIRYISEEFGEESLDRVLVLTSDESAAAILGERIHKLRRTDQVDELEKEIRGL